MSLDEKVTRADISKGVGLALAGALILGAVFEKGINYIYNLSEGNIPQIIEYSQPLNNPTNSPLYR